MESVLKAIELMIAMALIVVVLLQRSEGGALGMGGGGSGFGNLFSARGAANTLTRTTAILGALLFIVTMALTILAQRTTGSGSILTTAPAENAAPATPAPLPSENQTSAAPATTAPAAPANPLAPSVPASR